MEFFNIAALQRLANKSQPFIKAMEAWKKFYNTLSKDIPSKNALIVSIHTELDSLIDDYFKNPMQDKPTCKKGCSFCCHLYVTVSKNEARLLAHAITDLNLNIDMDLLKKQASFKKPEHWLHLNYQQRKCVFLKNNECSVLSVSASLLPHLSRYQPPAKLQHRKSAKPTGCPHLGYRRRSLSRNSPRKRRIWQFTRNVI